MGTLSFEPTIPPPLWVALAAAAAGLLVWYARRRPAAIARLRWAAIVLLMTMTVASVLVVLLNPTWIRPVAPPAGKPLVTLLVDATASMATPDAGAGGGAGRPITRFAAASSLAKSLGDQLAGAFDVRLRTFADRVSPIESQELGNLAPSGQSTDLAAAIGGALDADRPQGQIVLLLSDGIHNASAAAPVLAAARQARSLAAPVYTRTFGGGAGGGFDLGIAARTPQELSHINQPTSLVATLTHRGVPAGHAKVQLLRDGNTLETRDVSLSGDPQPIDVRFDVSQPIPGLYPYEVRVEPTPGELTEANNSAVFQLHVVDHPVRVLLVEGKPYWDSKFLTRTLGSDGAVELETVVRMAPGRLLRRTFPRSAATRPASQPATATATAAAAVEKWQIEKDAAKVLGDATAIKPYQIIVLGRDADEFLGEQSVENLRAWVAREGGSLLCFRGSPVAQVGQGLAKLMPVRWTPQRESRFRMKLTAQGEDLCWLGGGGAGDESLADLPTLATEARADRSKPLSIVLATATRSGAAADDAPPAVIYQPYGTGRVVVIEGSGMWRWAFLPPAEQQQASEIYGNLWHNLLRWLVSNTGLLPGQKLALRGDKVSYGTGEQATATLLLRADQPAVAAPSIELTGRALPQPRSFAATPAGDDPGAYRINFGKLAPGRYEARVPGDADNVDGKILFDVREAGDEQLNLQPRPDLMARIAADSGGAVLADGGASDVLRQLTRAIERARPQRVERTTAWDRPWVLALVLLLWTATWALRRGSGMV